MPTAGMCHILFVRISGEIFNLDAGVNNGYSWCSECATKHDCQQFWFELRLLDFCEPFWVLTLKWFARLKSFHSLLVRQISLEILQVWSFLREKRISLLNTVLTWYQRQIYSIYPLVRHFKGYKNVSKADVNFDFRVFIY